MNVALPVLLLGTLAGLLIRRRDLGGIWLSAGLAGMALLAPAWVLPQGIPSPAASLGAYAPWQGVDDPAEGNPLLRDVTFQIEPWSLFARRELRAGRLPQWNPHQFAGYPFWANGQSAPLFPLHLLFAWLPLPAGWTILPWIRFLVAGLGAGLFARELGLGEVGCRVAAVVYPGSGMLVSFLLFPMGNALALVPWVLWAVERLAAGVGSWRGLAVVASLQLLGGHPETVVHTALLAAVYLLLRCGRRAFGLLPGLLAGWGTAALVAAAQLVPLAMHLPATTKWLEPPAVGRPELGLALSQLFRLLLPQLYGHPAAGTWWGPFQYSATAVYVGSGALLLALAAVPGARWEARWRGILGILGVSVALAYHLPGLIDVVGHLPLLSRMAHHRLIFGVELSLAVLAGLGAERWLSGSAAKAVGYSAAALVAALLGAWALFGPSWQGRGLAGESLRWSLWAGLAALGLALGAWGVERLSLAPRRRLAVALTVALGLDLVMAHAAIHPGLDAARLYPRTESVRFLEGRQERVAGLGATLRPNAATVYGLFDLRGDDPLKLARFEEAYRRLAPADAVYFRPVEAWQQDDLLDRLGVRWVMAPPEATMGAGWTPPEGWRLAFAEADARVYERPGALPLVRGLQGAEEVAVTQSVPGLWEIELSAPDGGTVEVAEIWDAGWRASLEGSPVAVQAGPDALLKVEVPATGRSRSSLRLSYRAPGLVVGAWLSLLGIAILGSRALWRRAYSRRQLR